MLGTLQELADRVGGRVVGDGATPVARISTIEEATADALTFATEPRYLAAALQSQAAAVLVDAAIAPESGEKPLLVVENARLALARLLVGLRRSRPRGPFRHATAAIEPDAELADDVYVGAQAYVGRRVRIGRGSVIGAGAFVGDDVTIGESSWLQPHANVMEGCRVGNRVVLHAGCVIGSEGFGWAFIEGRLERIPQIGNVELDDDVEIGANTCVDRAQTGSTRIGQGTKIDNLVQIGHNCRIGKHCALASLTGLAGSTVIGDYVKVAGQVGTRGHMLIGSRSTVAGQSGVWGDVAEGATVSGNPARDHREELRREVMIRRLPKLVARVDALERALERERGSLTE
ncbi:MAG TPA: UDP-3-O-(3-hydroxymyristoyl)glucosamine N-acyltransferase [Candidatus Tumulicola sp.]|jgi:UDP-3-O-[3-hydroxymyristoyl] glucosamine N-acyltransferase